LVDKKMKETKKNLSQKRGDSLARQSHRGFLEMKVTFALLSPQSSFHPFKFLRRAGTLKRP
jgi:hypothetical protein